MIRYFFLFYIFSFTAFLFAQDDPGYKNLDIPVSFSDSVVSTGDRFIIQFSETLLLNKTVKFDPAVDYKFNYRNGIISLSKNLFHKYSLDTLQVYNLHIQYDMFPYSLKDEYSNFRVLIEKDTLTGDTVRISERKTDIVESLFEGTDLEKSGTLFRGLTVGSNRDLSLNSGFRLQLNGKLSKDINIIAALTDETTPIQPEGNTTKLQELDKVFIEMQSKNVTATLGDININFAESEFANFNRKIQGAKGKGEFKFGNFIFSGATSKGQFHTNSFKGIDGIQGPYRLLGKNSESNILVLAGTEKVFLEGIQMTRGDQADYIIDYGIGEITFTNKRIITNSSRIIVDFEYSGRKYSRTLLAGSSRLNFLKNKLSFDISYINEFDNKDKTIDFTLSDSDKVILQNAGNDPLRASKTGIQYLGRDSTGRARGQYVKSDTLINSSSYSFYRFSPNNDSAFYNVSFSLVGSGNGDYNKISSYQYDFVGLNQGNYAPVIFIPVPSAYQLADINMNFVSSPKKEFYLNLESAYSILDANKYSQIDEKGNGGVAFLGIAGFTKSNFKLFGKKIKLLDINVKERLVNKTFNSLDRLNAVEFNREYDVQDSSKVTEDLTEGYLKFVPNDFINIDGNIGRLKRGNDFSSLRTSARLEFKGDSLGLPDAVYNLELINSNNYSFGNKGRWLRQFAGLTYRKFLGKKGPESPAVSFSILYNGENRKNIRNVIIGDSLTFGSFSYNELIPRISLDNINNFSIFAELDYRRDNFLDNGFLNKESDSYIQTYGLSYSGIKWLTTGIDVTLRNRVFSSESRLLGNTDNKSVLVNFTSRIDPFNSALQTDLYYNVSSERTARVEKLFVQVPVGQGNYKYLGDINNNGIQDENEFELVNIDGDYVRLNIPTDKLFPVVDLRTSARILFYPSRMFRFSGNNILSDILKNISTESFYRIDEKSKDSNPNDLYFLKLNTFQNDSNTFAGTQLFQQDLNLFENRSDYSFKFRFSQQRGFGQFYSGNERLFRIEKLLRMRLGLVKDFSTQIEYINRKDVNKAPVTSVRNRDIQSDAFNTDLSYRPIQQIESGIQINFSKAYDNFPVKRTKASINQQIMRFIYSFATLGRIRLEVERDEILLSDNNIIIPYELTNGKVGGKSYFWRAFFDYSITKNIQASVNYDGRLEGSKRAIHTGRGEVRILF